jgi:hypothetical protein
MRRQWRALGVLAFIVLGLVLIHKLQTASYAASIRKSHEEEERRRRKGDVVGTTSPKNGDAITAPPLTQKPPIKAKDAGEESSFPPKETHAGVDAVTHHPKSVAPDPLHYELDINVVAPQKEICPLPVLHPELWQEKMSWGTRKQFPRCGRATRFSRLVTDNDLLQEGLEPDDTGGVEEGKYKAMLVIDGCDADREEVAVYGFKELLDSYFTRLTSTMDAEARQNGLKEHFDFSRIEDFGVKLKLKKHRNASSDLELNVATLTDNIPYVVAVCGKDHELHVTSLPLTLQHPHETHSLGKRRSVAHPRKVKPNQIQNILHVMIDSTSLYALRRDAKKVVSWMNRLNNRPDGASYVFPMKHYHAVSCCSPGNQIPCYSGNLNGEGDHFVRSEPFQDSKDWLWNIAAELGYTTFWSLDNCPDKSARDYHAFPLVDERVVAPLCMAGVLLSHKDMTCLAGKTVDQHVLDGLESFWRRNHDKSKFAAVQFITPHEETEKLLIEVDSLLSDYFSRLEERGDLNSTAIFFWSDHGINFGKYASTHDGEIEKMFPFANFILPRWFVRQNPTWEANLRHNMNMLTTPYDMYEVLRSLLFHPSPPPKFSHDRKNPHLPLPSQSHIIASFQKDVTPLNVATSKLTPNRSCWDANIPMEFCTCIPWKRSDEPEHKALVRKAFEHHRRLLLPELKRCHEPVFGESVLVEVQKWPTQYKPKEQEHAKDIWMKPNRDMVKVQYRTKGGKDGAAAGLFEAVFSVDKNDPEKVDLAHIDRLDAMKKKCGLVEKTVEHLCVCK